MKTWTLLCSLVALFFLFPPVYANTRYAGIFTPDIYDQSPSAQASYQKFFDDLRSAATALSSLKEEEKRQKEQELREIVEYVIPPSVQPNYYTYLTGQMSPTEAEQAANRLTAISSVYWAVCTDVKNGFRRVVSSQTARGYKSKIVT